MSDPRQIKRCRVVLFSFLDSYQVEYLLAMIFALGTGVDDAGVLAVREQDKVLLGAVLSGLGAGRASTGPPSSCLPEALNKRFV